MLQSSRSSVPASSEQAARRLVIDTDPGIDDAMALVLAAMCPEVELCAVTTVAGNVSLAQSTENARALLSAVGRDDVPVAPGASRGLVYPKPDHRAIHGENGLGDISLPVARVSAVRRHAVQVMETLLQGAPDHSVTIVAIAPLTNLALLLALHPELATKISEVVIMGGSVGAGNVTPVAEYNVWADPEAAQRVFISGVQVRLAQLQVTRLAKADDQMRKRLRAASHLGSRLDAMIDGYADEPGVVPALHDVVAMTAVVDHTLVGTRPAKVEVVTGLGPNRGQTLMEFGSARTEATVEVVVELDVERFSDLMIERISEAP